MKNTLHVLGRVCLSLLAGCEGLALDPLGEESRPQLSQPAKPVPPPAFDVGPAPLRRLSRAEYDGSVNALFGMTGRPSSDWPKDGQSTGFTTDVSGQNVTANTVEQMQSSAEATADAVLTRLSMLLPCSTSTTVSVAACGDQFIEKYGRRAYRRSLLAEDRASLKKVFNFGVSKGGLKAGVRLVVTFLLQSPSFLYRPELGGTEEVREGVHLVRLSPHELATRMAFALTQAAPDALLLEAADQDQLQSTEQITAQIERLMASAAGRATVNTFFSEWLHLERLTMVAKDPVDFPQFNQALRESIEAGTRKLVEHIVFDSEQGTMRELFTASYAFVDDRTAPLYGISTPVGASLKQVDVSHEPRAGLLSDVGLMTALSDSHQTSPVARGVFIWEYLLCQSTPSVPEGLSVEPPAPDPSLTTRERFAAHRTNPGCAGCHSLFDPPGFALENFDALGRYRATENGKQIDATGTFTFDGHEGHFEGAAELGSYLADHPAAARCLQQKWFAYASGRGVAPADAFSLYALSQLPAETRIKDVFASLILTPSFTHRAVTSVEACQ